MGRRSALRASDDDRDRVAERLRQAASEGRLLAHELEERLHSALRAQTYGELDAVVDDLPGSPASVTLVKSRPSSSLQIALQHPLAVGVAVAATAIALTSLVVTAVAVIASGLWLLPIVVYFVWPARRRHRQFGRGALRAHSHRMGRSRPGRIT